jgi:hypothetical protein
MILMDNETWLVDFREPLKTCTGPPASPRWSHSDLSPLRFKAALSQRKTNKRAEPIRDGDEGDKLLIAPFNWDPTCAVLSV